MKALKCRLSIYFNEETNYKRCLCG